MSKAGNKYAAFDNSAITVGQWNHIAVAYDGTQSAYNMVRLYINGVQVTSGIWYSTGNGLLPTTTPNTTAAFELGKSFNGKLDEVKLWNTAITAPQLEQKNTLNNYHSLYNNLISYWRMDNTPTAVKDQKNNYPGTYSNATLNAVTDNSTFKYKIVSSYIRSNFYESGQISEEYIRNNNDIIYMTGAPYANGDLHFSFPINNGTGVNTSYMASHASRNGVMDFAGTGASLNCGRDLLINPAGGVGSFTFASWVYVDSWIEGSYIFRKYETALKNVDLQLGLQSSNSLVFHFSNGADNYVTADNSGLTAGQWHHIAVTYQGGACAFQQVKIYVNGTLKPVTFKNTDGLVSATTPFSKTDFELGVNLDGKLDETLLSQISLSSGEVNTIKNNEVIVDSWNESKINAYWKYDDAGNPGKDYRTWVSVLDGIHQTLSGYEGAEVRLGVIGGDWKEMMKTDSARRNFAGKLKKMLSDYAFDGVDLDFEWCTTATEWNNYNATILAVNDSLPAAANFSVTLHPLYYAISPAAIAALDYISIQSYGPSPVRFPYSEFVNNVTAMLAYGYPAGKLVMGLPFYGVTTDNTKITPSYKNIVTTYPTLDPALDTVTLNVTVTIGSGCGATSQVVPKNITFNGQQTISNKTKYVYDQGLAGVMYWDMATDVDFSNSLSLLRAVTSVTNANVDSIGNQGGYARSGGDDVIEEIQPEKIAPEISFAVYPNPAGRSGITVNTPAGENGVLSVYNIAGQHIVKQAITKSTVTRIATDKFQPGIYFIQYLNNAGSLKTKKIVVQ